MSTLIEAIGPLAFWIIVLGVAPAVLLVSVMALINRVSDRFSTSKTTKNVSRAS